MGRAKRGIQMRNRAFWEYWGELQPEVDGDLLLSVSVFKRHQKTVSTYVYYYVSRDRLRGCMMGFAYRFPAVRGVQAGRRYYISMVPLRMLLRLFVMGEDSVLPEHRAQRRLNEQRIPEIANYILDNPDTYVFSALAASVDGELEFHDGGVEGLGTLEISMDATLLVNDGQHRIAAILAALEERPELGAETISVVLFEDRGLSRSQQMFTDLNKHAVRTSNSIAELYDSRDLLAVATRDAVAAVPFLNRYTDKERDNLGKFSSSLFTLNTFYKANRKILGKREPDERFYGFLAPFWLTVSEHMVPWRELQPSTAAKVALKEETIATQGVSIRALGRVGAALWRGEGGLGPLEGLERIDWSRSNPLWQGRAISENGRIISNEGAGLLIANAIKLILGIGLSEDEAACERELAQRLGKGRK